MRARYSDHPMIKDMLLVVSLFFGVIFALVTVLLWYFQAPLALALGFSVFVVFLQYILSPRIINFFYKIEFNEERKFLSEEVLFFIHETCATAGIPVPRIGIIKDGNPNAFTYGTRPSDARVVVTTGLLAVLNEKEQEAVIAHELGHIKNYDFALMAAVNVIPMFAYQIYLWCNRRDNTPLMWIGWGAFAVYILSEFAVLSFSRLREYCADHFAKQMMNSGEELKTALIKIAYGLYDYECSLHEESETKKGKKKAPRPIPAMLGFASNNSAIQSEVLFSEWQSSNGYQKAKEVLIQWESKSVWAKWYQLNSTHPLNSKRIAALSDQEMIIENPIKIGAVLRFIFDQLVSLLPWIVMIAETVIYVHRLSFSAFLNAFWNHPHAIVLLGISILVRYYYCYEYRHEKKSIQELLADENASPVKGIPVILEGEVIGRGEPGLFYSADISVNDGTGIMMVKYFQPLRILEFLFGCFTVEKLVSKDVQIIGWYKRGLLPYLECRYILADGKRFTCLEYILTQAMGYCLLGLGVIAGFFAS